MLCQMCQGGVRPAKMRTCPKCDARMCTHLAVCSCTSDKHERRREVAEKCRDIQDERKVDVRLNGKPAVICGFQNPFGQVYSMDDMLGCEFAWETIHHILAKEGKEAGAFSSR